MKTEYVIWGGVTDRIIGVVQNTSPFGSSNVQRLDGTVCTVQTSRLQPCPMDYVDWAIWLGGCTIPKTGKPPINCVHPKPDWY